MKRKNEDKGDEQQKAPGSSRSPYTLQANDWLDTVDTMYLKAQTLARGPGKLTPSTLHRLLRSTGLHKKLLSIQAAASTVSALVFTVCS